MQKRTRPVEIDLTQEPPAKKAATVDVTSAAQVPPIVEVSVQLCICIDAAY